MGVKFGDKVHIPGLGWRTINERSSGPTGVEIFTGKKGSVPDRLKIDKVQRGSNPPQDVSMGSHTFNYHIHADGAEKGAVASIKDALKDHTTHFLEQMQRADQESYRRSFA